MSADFQVYRCKWCFSYQHEGFIWDRCRFFISGTYLDLSSRCSAAAATRRCPVLWTPSRPSGERVVISRAGASDASDCAAGSGTGSDLSRWIHLKVDRATHLGPNVCSFCSRTCCRQAAGRTVARWRPTVPPSRRNCRIDTACPIGDLIEVVAGSNDDTAAHRPAHEAADQAAASKQSGESGAGKQRPQTAQSGAAAADSTHGNAAAAAAKAGDIAGGTSGGDAAAWQAFRQLSRPERRRAAEQMSVQERAAI